MRNGMRRLIGIALCGVLSTPCWAQPFTLSASNGALDDRFGIGVSIDGPIAVVGASFTGAVQGSVYVFELNSNGEWVQKAELRDPIGVANDNFGHKVSLSGTTVAVSVEGDDDHGLSSGAVFIYKRNADGSWPAIPTQELRASNPAATDNFGTALALDGDRLLVGAQEHDTGGLSNSGMVWVFENDPTTATWWTETAQLQMPPSPVDSAGFGSSVALDGDTALVGAIFEGAAFVFDYNGSSWSAGTRLVSPDGASGDFFGGSVALRGDLALVGATRHTHSGFGVRAGAAYIFRQDTTTTPWIWSSIAELLPCGNATGDGFGGLLALGARGALIGVPREDDPVLGADTGAAYLFEDHDGMWLRTKRMTDPDAASGNLYGHAVDLDGDTAFVGAMVGDGGVTDAGAAYIHDLNLEGPVREYGVGCSTCPNSTPTLRFGGCSSCGGEVTLSVRNLPGAFGLLVIGFSPPASVPLPGCGDLLVFPIHSLLPIPLFDVGCDGHFTVTTTLPPAIGPLTFTMQAFGLNSNPPGGWIANTNGVEVTIDC